MMSSVPDPPESFDPLVEILEPGAVIYRFHNTVFAGSGHQVENDGTVPNPGFGKTTRLGFFGNPVVPVLYAATTQEAVIHETVLHSYQPGMTIPLTRLTHRAMTPVEVIRPLKLISYRSAGLRLGPYPRDLTDTLAEQYSQTVKWGKAAWDYGADGVAYMCRHFNGEAAYCLYGADHSSSLKHSRAGRLAVTSHYCSGTVPGL